MPFCCFYLVFCSPYCIVPPLMPYYFVSRLRCKYEDEEENKNMETMPEKGENAVFLRIALLWVYPDCLTWIDFVCLPENKKEEGSRKSLRVCFACRECGHMTYMAAAIPVCPLPLPRNELLLVETLGFLLFRLFQITGITSWFSHPGQNCFW